jgi:hypothetical protein
MEARRILAEHRDLPTFVRGRVAFQLHRDGKVSLFRETPKRRTFQGYLEIDSRAIPADIRQIFAERYASYIEKHTPAPDNVIRYVVTYVNADEQRTLASAAQGRNTHETRGEAQRRLDAMLENNSSTVLASVYGANPRFEVRPCPCWPGHFDPKGVYFD